MEPLRKVSATLLLFVLLLTAAVRSVEAQPNGNEMCGDGTTFEVQLPATNVGIDDSEGLFRIIDAPPPPPDTVVLPNGCRIYAILVSGYSNNKHFYDWPFYKLAEFVARNNGYVHFSWWNNLLQEYLVGPLHPVNITVRRLFGLLDDIVIPPSPNNPHTVNSLLAFAPSAVDLPKANPDEDYQFQSDASRVIRAIRQRNPNALIIVAGHSMGGNAVVRLGMNRDLEIDLLAPIDPVGNRDKPRAMPFTDNWTRWRVANQFRGFKQWDCVRTDFGFCRDYDSRLLHTRFECVPVGPYLPVRPLIATRAPFACPRLPTSIEEPASVSGRTSGASTIGGSTSSSGQSISCPRSDWATLSHDRPPSSARTIRSRCCRACRPQTMIGTAPAAWAAIRATRPSLATPPTATARSSDIAVPSGRTCPVFSSGTPFRSSGIGDASS
jgi:pimeloyl-ACP methyl ester carboxylesterase